MYEEWSKIFKRGEPHPLTKIGDREYYQRKAMYNNTALADYLLCDGSWTLFASRGYEDHRKLFKSLRDRLYRKHRSVNIIVSLLPDDKIYIRCGNTDISYYYRVDYGV